MRIESSPQGKLVEALLATAFAAHPYQNSAQRLGQRHRELPREPEAEAFYKSYYTPANMTIGIAGDVNPAEAKRLAEKYFGRLPAGPLPPLVRTVEPQQEGEKRVAVESPAQPFLLIGYKRPDQYSKDDAALDVLSDILSDGRTGIIYKEMVRDKKIALGAESQRHLPRREISVAVPVLSSCPRRATPSRKTRRRLYGIIDGVKKEQGGCGIAQRVKTKLRAALIRKLDSNSGSGRRTVHLPGQLRRLAQAVHRARRIQQGDRRRRAARGQNISGGKRARWLIRTPRQKEGAK